MKIHNKFKNNRERQLRFEALEQRQMLSITPTEYAAICQTYTSLDLPADISKLNVIEISAEDLSLESINNALKYAYEESNKFKSEIVDDLIVVRTTAEKNTITYDSSITDETIVNLGIDYGYCGAITLVSWGDSPLTIDANGFSTAMLLNKKYHIEYEEEIYEGDSVAHAGIGGIILTNGQTTELGGGIFVNHDTVLTMQDCTIKMCTAVSGAGLYLNTNSTTLLQNVTITDCTASKSGGGLYWESATAILENSKVNDNTAPLGGGIYSYNSKVTLVSTQIIGNDATNTGQGMGGGIADVVQNPGDKIVPALNLYNCVVAENSADGVAGGIILTGKGTFVHSTIANNQSESLGGGLVISGGTYTMYNSILATNIGTTYNDLYDAGTCNGFVGNLSSVSKTGNTLYDDQKPLFANVTNKDYRPAPDSQAIDVGNNAYAKIDDKYISADITGWCRLVGSAVDAGAYEAHGNSQAVSIEKNSENQLIYTVADENVKSFAIVADVTHGQTTIDSENHKVFYTPTTNYTGYDSIILELTNSSGEKTLVGVTMAVVEPSPEVVQFAPITSTTADATSASTPGTNTLPDTLNSVNEWIDFYLELWLDSNRVEENVVFTASIVYDSDMYVPSYTKFADGLIYESYDYSQPDEQGLVTLTMKVAYDKTFCNTVDAYLYALMGEVFFEPTIRYATQDDKTVYGVTASEIFVDSALKVNEVSPKLDIWAVPYDLDDTGKIDSNDFIDFATVYGCVPEPKTIEDAADSSGNKKVDSQDFINFATAYGMSYKKCQGMVIPRQDEYYTTNVTTLITNEAVMSIEDKYDEIFVDVVTESSIQPTRKPIQWELFDVTSHNSVDWLWRKDYSWEWGN